MIHKVHMIAKARVPALGFTFKENCPDLRKTRVNDLERELEAFGTEVEIYDPHADSAEAQHEYFHSAGRPCSGSAITTPWLRQ
jgi:UDP-N-acetyl-D-galactosamine dehydrogenase